MLRVSDADLYQILQVHPCAEPEIVEAAYRRLCRKYHPDVNRAPDAEARMKEINAAFEVLGNPARRAEYDHHAARNRSDGPAGRVKEARNADPAPRAPRTPETGPAGPTDARVAAPRLGLSTTSLSLVPPTSGTESSASFEVVNLGGGLLEGRVVASATWLSASPLSFSSNRLWIRVVAQTGGLPPSLLHEASLSIETNGGTARLAVLARAAGPRTPRLDVAPRSVLLGSSPSGLRRTAVITIGNGGGGLLSGSACCQHDWLQLDRPGFCGNLTLLRVTADLESLPAGLDHYTAVDITSNGGTAHVPVQVYVVP